MENINNEEERVMCICGRSKDGLCHCAEWGQAIQHIYDESAIDEFDEYIDHDDNED